MSMRPWMGYAAVAVVIVGGVALKLARGGETKQVEIQAVELHALAPSILASGTLAYQSEVKLVPEVIGRVLEIPVSEGDRVKRGQLLLRLDPATPLAEIAQIEAELNQSRLSIEQQRVVVETQRAKWKRYESLRAQGIVDANTYEEIASQRKLSEFELNTNIERLQQTQALYKQARERLAKTEFRAPIDGTVTAIFIKVGETAVPSAMSIAGSDLMVIANTTSMYAEVNVDETDVARVSVGQRASVVPAAFPDSSWPGKVERVAISPRQAPGQSKSYAVRILLADGNNGSFHAGMSCRVEIVTGGNEAARTLAVPVQAVRYEDSADKKSKASVFLVSSGKALRRDVETGSSDDTYIAIVKGLAVGERVVVGPAKILRLLQDGDRIAYDVKALAPVKLNP